MKVRYSLEDVMNVETRGPIDAFLDAVDMALIRAGKARSTRVGIVSDLELHILDALRERAAGREPVPTDVVQVLETLGPPEAYANGSQPVAGSPARARRMLAPHLATGGVLI